MRLSTIKAIEQATGLHLSYSPNSIRTLEVYQPTTIDTLANYMDLKIAEYYNIFNEKIEYKVTYKKYLPNQMGGLYKHPKTFIVKTISCLIKNIKKLSTALQGHQCFNANIKQLTLQQHKVLKKISCNKPQENDIVYKMSYGENSIYIDIYQTLDYINEFGAICYGSLKDTLKDLKGAIGTGYISDHPLSQKQALKLYKKYKSDKGVANTTNTKNKVCLFDGTALWCFKHYGEALAHHINTITGGSVKSEIITQ